MTDISRRQRHGLARFSFVEIAAVVVALSAVALLVLLAVRGG